MLIGLFILVGCASDDPPSYEPVPASEPIVRVSPELPELSEVPAPTEQSQSSQPVTITPGRSGVTNSSLMMVLDDELDVYRWPGDDWQPFISYKPLTVVSTDSWTELENGEIWLHIALSGDLSQLPVYTGPVAGKLAAWNPSMPGGIHGAVNGWGVSFSAWPNGPQHRLALANGRYPVLGRSLDSEWIALRVDSLHPSDVGLPLSEVNLEIEVADLPIYLSRGAEVVTLDADGRAVASIFFSEWSDLEMFLNDREVLLRVTERGTLVWDVMENETRWLTDRRLFNLSPDGQYAVGLFWDDESLPEYWQQPARVALVSIEDGSEVTFTDVTLPWPLPPMEREVGPFWSADSRWLMSNARQVDGPDRYVALSVNGEQVEIVPSGYLRNWRSLRETESADEALVYLSANGEEIARPWSDEVFEVAAPQWRPFPEVPERWEARTWSPDGRLFLAERFRYSEEFDENGFASTLPGLLNRQWWYGKWELKEWRTIDVGVFDEQGRLRQVFRGYGGHCDEVHSKASWSPDSKRLLFRPFFERCGCCA